MQRYTDVYKRVNLQYCVSLREFLQIPNKKKFAWTLSQIWLMYKIVVCLQEEVFIERLIFSLLFLRRYLLIYNSKFTLALLW